MMSSNGTHSIKRNDNIADFKITGMKYADGSDVIFVTGDRAYFTMRKKGGTNVINKQLASPVIGQSICIYEWQAGDTDTDGIYHAEMEVQFANGNIGTWPTKGYYTVEIGQDLA